MTLAKVNILLVYDVFLDIIFSSNK